MKWGEIMENRTDNYSILELGSFENLSKKEAVGRKGKLFLADVLGLTGCEVSLNRLSAGQGVPFVHAHKKNEELYIIIKGTGTFFIDGSEFSVQEGSVIRIAPGGERSWKADDQDLYFICIQAQEGSLTQCSAQDGIRVPTKVSWMNQS